MTVLRRRGFTLVELLVVTGLIASLLGLVVAGIRGGQQSRKPGASALAAAMAAAQGRALGVAEGAGIILTPDSATPAACGYVYDASMLPLIQATVTGVPPTLPALTFASGTVTPLNADDVQRAYKAVLSGSFAAGIGPASPWFNFTPTSVTTGTFQFRTSLGQTLGQTPNNTIWPKPPVGGTFNATLAQYPVTSTSFYQFDKTTAIDLRFSGVGDDRTAFPGKLDGNGSIAVVFDRAGRVAEIIPQVPAPGATVAPGAALPETPKGTIYFLVAARDVIASGSNSLASADAIWVALSPQTGRVFTAANVVQSGTDSSALRAARANARTGIAK